MLNSLPTNAQKSNECVENGYIFYTKEWQNERQETDSKSLLFTIPCSLFMYSYSQFTWQSILWWQNMRPFHHPIALWIMNIRIQWIRSSIQLVKSSIWFYVDRIVSKFFSSFSFVQPKCHCGFNLQRCVRHKFRFIYIDAIICQFWRISYDVIKVWCIRLFRHLFFAFSFILSAACRSPRYFNMILSFVLTWWRLCFLLDTDKARKGGK